MGGLLVLHLLTLGLFRLGVAITPWHGLAFFPPALAFCYLILTGSGRAQKTGLLLAAMLGVCGFLVLISAQLDDLSWDGMNRRIESVLALSKGWNPDKDPKFKRGVRLAKRNPELGNSFVVKSGYQYSFGNLLSANLVKITGNLNSGKATTPILMIASFGIAFGGLTSLSLPVGWCLALALLAALNPVSIYQSSSYYIDGHVAALFTATLFSAFRILVIGIRSGEAIAFLASFFALCAAKTSGILYGVIISLVLIGFYAGIRTRNIRNALWLIGVFAVLIYPAGFFLRASSKFTPLTIKYLTDAINRSTSGTGLAIQAFGTGDGLQRSRLQEFGTAYFAPTEACPRSHQTKFPFYFTRSELSVFEDLSPDPRAGGFGPLFGGCLIFALVSLGMIPLGRTPPIAALFPLATVLLSIGLPQAVWVRWAPQGWLLPISLILPVIAALRNQPAGLRWMMPLLALFTGLLNAVLILAFYSVGCVKAQRVLASQIEFIKNLPRPVRVHTPIFKSNRLWFIRNKIRYVNLNEAPPCPRMLLHRTQTRVALPSGFQPETDLSPQTWKEWERRKLLEL